MVVKNYTFLLQLFLVTNKSLIINYKQMSFSESKVFREIHSMGFSE
jgi:hypothetical protein